MKVLDALLTREWMFKEGNKIYCPTCGIEHRETVKRPKHRKGCEYRTLLEACGAYRKMSPTSPELQIF